MLPEDSGVLWDSNSPSESCLGSVRVYSFIISYTPENIKCASQVSLLSRPLASPCLGREPKVRVATSMASLTKGSI